MKLKLTIALSIIVLALSFITNFETHKLGTVPTINHQNGFPMPDYSKYQYPVTQDFQFILGFGYYARNVLNTFDDSFTKDLVSDFATTDFVLSKTQKKSIEDRMRRINIMKYPDVFKPLNNNYFITPYSTYYLKIQMDGIVKEIYWEDENLSNEPGARQLRNLIQDHHFDFFNFANWFNTVHLKLLFS